MLNKHGKALYVKKLLLWLLFLKIASSWGALNEIGKALYPDNNEDQEFVTSFFKVVELHKTNDPLLEGSGPSLTGYSIDKMPFAFMVNRTNETVDLVIFNWRFGALKQLEPMRNLTSLYGSPVYKMARVLRQKIATQGDNFDKLTNLSYVMGADHQAGMFKLAHPGEPVPDIIKNFKPNPLYMDGSEPLRKALGTQTLTLLSPEKELLYDLVPDMSREEIDRHFELNGGFSQSYLAMMIHEMFHVKEGDDHASHKSKPRITPNYESSLAPQLNSDSYLVDLFNLYTRIVFSLSDSLTKPKSSAQENEDLANLDSVIKELKSKYPIGWSYIRNYEYTEGFAEYASSFSMVEAGIFSLADSMIKQKTDLNNNFVYRTGAIGGHYLVRKLKELPFLNQEDHAYGIWEIILDKLGIKPSSKKMDAIFRTYESYPLEEEIELENLIEYVSQH